MSKRTWIISVSLLTLGFLHAETVTYTTPQTVDTVLTGETAVKVACPALDFISLTQANSYTGGTELVSGGIIVSNVNALGTGPIRCHSGTALLIMVSYRDAQKDLKSELLDRIEVLPHPEEGNEPWVSIQVQGEGLKNDIDFTGQPFLWLGTPQYNKWEPVFLDGTFEPCGNIYRFGYNQSKEGGYQGLRVPTICDAPDGTPRQVLCRGRGAVTMDSSMGNYTWTGGIRIQEGLELTFFRSEDLGKIPETVKADHVILEDGAILRAGWSDQTYAETIGITIRGTVNLHLCGAQKKVISRFYGPFNGEGKIRLTDQGGIAFLSGQNTFTGTLTIPNDHQHYEVDLIFGNGDQMSWAGSSIETRLPNQRIILNTNQDRTFSSIIQAKGPVIKQGTGTLTLSQPLTVNLSQPIPLLQIHQGTLRLGGAKLKLSEEMILIKEDACLDLNHIPVESLPLPIGEGSIINPAGESLSLIGKVPITDSFSGRIDSGITVVNKDYEYPWELAKGCSIAGRTTLSEGCFHMRQGTEFSAPLQLDTYARLIFPEIPETVDGLRVDYWFNINWKEADNHSAHIRQVIDEVSKTVPDLQADTAPFGEFLKSGNTNPEEGTVGQPFANALGGTKDNFAALFRGYFVAEQEGDYTFQIGKCDDAAALFLGEPLEELICTHDSQVKEKTVHLTQGYHPIRVYFSENWGWEVLHVNIKCPGDTQFGFLPTRLLKKWATMKTTIHKLQGTGTIQLEEGAEWPTILDSSEFRGTVLANTGPATPSQNGLTLHQASLLFSDPWEAFGSEWGFYGSATPYREGRSSAFRLIKGAPMQTGSINSRKRIPLQGRWKLEFDFQAIPPHAPNMGDGFSLVLHDSGVRGHNSHFTNYQSDPRIEDTTSYGIQLYLMPGEGQFTWIKGGFIDKRLGGMVVNHAYTMNGCKQVPMHVCLAYDGESTLSITLSQEGRDPWTSSNRFAGEDFQTRFPNGAYLGIWGRTAGYFTAMKVDNLKLENMQIPSSETGITYSSPLQLAGGTLSIDFDGSPSGTLSSPLSINGDAILNSDEKRDLLLETPTWSFDLTDSITKLTLSGAHFIFSQEPITIHATGEVPAKSRVLADLTGVTGSTQPTFVLGADAPKGAKLTFTDGLLSIRKAVGTRILLQ